MADMLLLPQLILTAVMVGVIWQVQLLTYPQFLRVGRGEFGGYHRAHTFRMGAVVVPPMLLEMGLAVVWVWHERSLASIGGLALVGAVWVVTAVFQVLAHRKLAEGWDEGTIRRLVRTNWLRTVLWTVRLGLLTLAVGRGEGAG